MALTREQLYKGADYFLTAAELEVLADTSAYTHAQLVGGSCGPLDITELKALARTLARIAGGAEGFATRCVAGLLYFARTTFSTAWPARRRRPCGRWPSSRLSWHRARCSRAACSAPSTWWGLAAPRPRRRPSSMGGTLGPRRLGAGGGVGAGAVAGAVPVLRGPAPQNLQT